MLNSWQDAADRARASMQQAQQAAAAKQAEVEQKQRVIQGYLNQCQVLVDQFLRIMRAYDNRGMIKGTISNNKRGNRKSGYWSSPRIFVESDGDWVVYTQLETDLQSQQTCSPDNPDYINDSVVNMLHEGLAYILVTNRVPLPR